jgi:glycosyltransferase involved in cell wall biosynthesis
MTSVTLCAIARDEGRYILEWLAWYKLLGFEHIVIYDNESQDESTSILPALHQAREIDHRPWASRHGEQPQLPAYRDGLARCSTEWIAFFDVDEFLVLHSAQYIADLLGRLPEDCSAIAFNQRFFGSSGRRDYDDRFVTERFTRTSRRDHFLNVWVKTIARRCRIKSINNPHGFELTSGYYVEPGGRLCILQNECRTREISLDVAQYNHYILKSKEEYSLKKARGRADVASDDPGRLDKYTDDFFVLHDVNVCEEDSASRWTWRLRIERDRLHRLCTT